MFSVWGALGLGAIVLAVVVGMSLATGGKLRKQWNDDDMVAAMQAVEKKELTISAAATRFNVPRKTLDDRIKGRVQHGTTPGPSTVLTTEEEDALESYLIYMAQRGFPLTRTMTKAFAWAIAKRSGKADRFNPEYGPSEHWWTNFRKRHPRLTLRTTDKLERSRAEALSPEIVKEYFETLKPILERNNLLNLPRQLYNCDETFLPLDFTREKAVTLKNTKYVYAQAHGTTDHITVLCAASAAGLPLPPFIIYPKSFPGGQYRFDGPDDALYGKSESGWIDSELFMAWLKKIFLKHVVAQRPVVLFIDRHKTHMTLDVIDLCRENEIILFCLPPHTTHALQPLDVAVFKSLKDHFSKSVRALAFSKPNFVVSKRDFAKVFKGPFERAFSITNVKAGFEKSGIFPFNPDAIAVAKTLPSALYSPQSSGPSCPQSSASNTSNTSTEDSDSTFSAVSPSPTVSPWCSQSSQKDDSHTGPPDQVCPTATSTPQSSSLIVNRPQSSYFIANPLVAAGLVPVNLADILAPPSEGAAASKKRAKRITGARELTANEYTARLKEEERKKKEVAEEKERKKEERKRKREEKEEANRRKKAEREEARKKKAVEKEEVKKRKEGEKEKIAKLKKGSAAKPSARPRLELPTDSSSDSAPSSGEQDSSSEPSFSRPKRQRQLPARFRNDSDSSSEDDDAVLCAICHAKEPTCAAKTVFWVDCEMCGAWVHSYCAFQSNSVSRRYTCDLCSASQ